MTQLPLPRSLLYVPAHDERMVTGAARRGAEAIILDLEDAVPVGAKTTARDRLSESVRAVGMRGARVIVRTNSVWSLAWRDLEAAVAAGADGILLTKVATVGAVEVTNAFLRELAARADAAVPDLLVTIETAPGLEAVSAIAAALADARGATSERWTALIPGNEDLSLDLNVEPSPDVMLGALWPIVRAARAHGHALFGSIGSGSEYRDLDAYRRRIHVGRAHGFNGVTCIHPAQIDVVHDVYRPTDAAFAWAAEVVTAFEAGDGEAVGVDGRMVDRPVYLRARRLLEEARR